MMDTHPAHAELVRRYRAAREMWTRNHHVQEAALLLSIDERAYCDQYILTTPPLLWTGSSSQVLRYAPLDYDRAFQEGQP